MFENLTDRLSHTMRSITGKARLSEDNIKDALKEFDGDYDTEELRLMRIKFISEVAN
mgnify:CR=1 FL=1